MTTAQPKQQTKFFAPRMTVAEAFEFAQKAFKAYKKDPSFENMTEYNWWVDVVNFKEGKETLPYQYEHKKTVQFGRRVDRWLED